MSNLLLIFGAVAGLRLLMLTFSIVVYALVIVITLKAACTQ